MGLSEHLADVRIVTREVVELEVLVQTWVAQPFMIALEICKIIPFFCHLARFLWSYTDSL